MRSAKTTILLLLVFMFLVSCRKPLDVRITSPADDATVSEQPVVEGKVSDPRAEVWVVVHVLETGENSDYWVQPQAAVKPDGTWTARIYVGEPGGEDVGKAFVLMAVANPKEPLESGNVLEGWPGAAAQSNVVEVVRK